MNTLRYITVTLLLSTFISTSAWCQSACGNCNKGGGAGTGNPNPAPNNPTKTNPSNPDPGKGDPVVPYTGNEYKRVDDLTLWGAVGGIPMRWSRYSNSRAVGGAGLFGMAHYWRHSWQWELAPTSPDATGRSQLILIYPDGAQYTFVQTAPGVWQPTQQVTDTLIQTSTGFELYRNDSTRCIFQKFISGSSFYCLMTAMKDAAGNTTTLVYNANRKLISITEPAGRSFNIAYKPLSGSQLSSTIFGLLLPSGLPPTDPDANWQEVAVTSTNAARYVRLIEADGSYGQIAGLEFYEAGTGKLLTGSIISSDPLHADLAFSGNPSTGWVSASPSGGFVGLDLGTAHKIGRIRYLIVKGKEHLLHPMIVVKSGFGASVAKVVGSNEAPYTVQAISSVTSSDGRAVNYQYTPFVDPTLPYTFPSLTAAVYGDGTQATYGLTQVFPGTRPLVTDWNDPRYDLRQAHYKTIYQSSTTGAIAGAVQSQVNSVTGGTILAISLLNGNLHRPTVTYANGGVETQYYNTSLPGGAAIVQESDANGRMIYYTYTSQGYIATSKDALGRVTSFTWTQQGNPLTKTYPDGSTESWSYNALESLLSHTDNLGRVTSYARDASNRVTAINYPDGSSEAFSYNNLGQPLTHILRSGGTESFTYNARGLRLSKTDPLGNVTSYGYDTSDRLNRVTDALGHTTTMAYNERGLMTNSVNPDGSSKSFTYTLYGDVQSESNELGATWSYTYDEFRRLTSVTDPLGRVTTTAYRPDSIEKKPLSVTLPSGKKTIFQYDRAWNLTSKTEGAGSADAATTSYSYDNVNNLIRMVDGTGKAWTYTYDNRNRRISAKDPLGNTTLVAYDAEGNLVSSTRPDGKTSSSTYDAMNRLTSTTDQAGNTTSFAYDGGGNLLSTTDAKGGTYSYSYDSLNRRLSMSYPSTSGGASGGTSEQWSYDGVGNLSTYTTRAGQVCSYSYDTRNRNTGYHWSGNGSDGTSSVAKSYDVAGRLLSLSNAASVITYSYDSANELLSETQSVTGQQPHTLSYSYDLDGNRVGVTYPSGSQLGLGYNGRNLPASIVVDGTSMASFAYDGNGKRVSRTLENGISTTATYDTASRLTGLSSPVASYSYSLDSLGRRTTRSESTALGVKSDSYAYDPISQLTGVNYASGARSTYAYDALGNRTTVTTTASGSGSGSGSGNSIIIPYLANACNQYTQIGGLLVSYDANGNLTSDQNGNTYTYDAQNRLVSARSGTNTMYVSYDARNRVVSRTINGIITSYAYDGWNLIEDYDASGNELARYIHGPQDDELLAKITPTGAVYYIQDGNHNVTTITDGTGSVVERYTYDVYGTPTITDGAGNVLTVSGQGNRFMFTGREYLAEIGIYDYRNRVYSANLGRFLQTDPIRFQAGDINIYRYVGNSPVNGTDPSGELCLKEILDALKELEKFLKKFDPTNKLANDIAESKQRGNKTESLAEKLGSAETSTDDIERALSDRTNNFGRGGFSSEAVQDGKEAAWHVYR